MPDDPTPSPPQTQPETQGSLSRRSMEEVIRRAVELSLDEADADQEITEEELIRISGELGLSPRHVRQALYERPVEEREADFLDRNLGPTNITVSRAIPCDHQIAHGRLEDYLVTREYLQLRRKQGTNAYFEPADDAFSSIARTFSRPSSRFHLARAQKAYLTVRPLESGYCHVRLELSFPEKRKTTVTTGVVTSGLFGTFAAGLGGFVGFVLAGGLSAAVGAPEPIAAIAVGAAAGGALTVSGIVAACRAEYRRWLGKTKDEAEALLDRLEHGDTLQPPAAPWMRRLQQKLRSFGKL